MKSKGKQSMLIHHQFVKPLFMLVLPVIMGERFRFYFLNLFRFTQKGKRMKLSQLASIMPMDKLKEAWFSFQLKLMQPDSLKRNMKRILLKVGN